MKSSQSPGDPSISLRVDEYFHPFLGPNIWKQSYTSSSAPLPLFQVALTNGKIAFKT
eukprot:CAMPEP_0170485968 /NCGR_PEP_ID=MMETSP0208-20121228/5110_1 /TAXON_ID=197538 /ORGANISM="Strombidium inclinatum, Strain S3" /LENGTH=56 /DNA_ID=CAMNT_0010759783 /DNA_START=29 /DNA_END=199 /DNA_ORIENTATION=+